MTDTWHLNTVLGLIDHRALKEGLVNRPKLCGSARAILRDVIQDGGSETTIDKKLTGPLRTRELRALEELCAIGLPVNVSDSDRETFVEVSPNPTLEKIFGAAQNYLDELGEPIIQSDAYGAFELLVALYCRTGRGSLRRKRFFWPIGITRLPRMIEILRPYGYNISIVDGGAQLVSVLNNSGVVMPIQSPTAVLDAEPPADADYDWFW